MNHRNCACLKRSKKSMDRWIRDPPHLCYNDTIENVLVMKNHLKTMTAIFWFHGHINLAFFQPHIKVFCVFLCLESNEEDRYFSSFILLETVKLYQWKTEAFSSMPKERWRMGEKTNQTSIEGKGWFSTPLPEEVTSFCRGEGRFPPLQLPWKLVAATPSL